MKIIKNMGSSVMINPPVHINSRENVNICFQAELNLLSLIFCKLKSNQGIQVIEFICPTCCKSDMKMPENPQIVDTDIAV